MLRQAKSLGIHLDFPVNGRQLLSKNFPEDSDRALTSVKALRVDLDEKGIPLHLLMLPEASPQWQQAIFIVATLFLIYQVWRGWKLGAVRGLLRLAALFCAWIGGSMAAGATGTFLALFSKIPPLLAPSVAAVVVGLIIYLVISFIAGLLFKRTDDHEGIIRLLFGFFGALLGLIYGLMLLYGGITLIRGLGTLGELRLVQAQREARPVSSEPMAQTVIKLKNSLELGESGGRLKGFDLLPTAYYDNIVKASMIAGNPQALQRFVQYPATLELLKNPKILAFLQDPALQKAADTRNFFPLLENKLFLSLLQDPELLAQLKNFDLTGAFNFALQGASEQPPSDPSQIKVQHGKYRQRVSPPSPPSTIQGKIDPLPNQTATPKAQ